MDNTENSYIPIHVPVNKKYDMRHSSPSIAGKDSYVSPGAQLWQSALKKLRSRCVVSEPWTDFNVETVPTLSAIRHRFSAIKKKWIKDEVIVKLEQTSFDRGAMRECFRMKKVSNGGDWFAASNYVAKRYIANVNSSVYFDDVRLQMEAKLWAEEFNRQDPPKKVDVFQMSVMEIQQNPPTSPTTISDSKRRGSFSTQNTSFSPAGGGQEMSSFYHIERFMDGEYRKYNSNSGFVDAQLRNTPQAFSHFTFERSGHRILVVDIQGVGDLYTDPQIHTSDGLGYNEGNLGIRGMALFFHSHKCNPLCHWLGLTPFDLSNHETLELIEISQIVHFGSDDEDTHSEDSDIQNISISPFDGYQFSKAPVAPFISLPRKRSVSFGVFPLNNSYNATSLKGNRRLFGPTVARDHEFNITPRLRTFSGSANSFVNSASNTDGVESCLRTGLMIHSASGDENNSRLHQRQKSGDSGVAFLYNTSMRPPVRRISSTVSDDQSDSLGDFLDESPLPPFSDVFQEVYSGFACPVDDFIDTNADSRFRQLRRGPRTSSESSDVDELEAVRLASHSLHHILHETQKPSSAAHPSNLDQEIGQSILGQIHHELARLHEAGRFLKRPGGWSKTGIGSLYPQSPDEAEIENSRGSPVTAPPDLTINWESVIFHEHQAAQLGCLEALIIMAHYYLGLPTQLLSECTIKARHEDLGLGVDYLWRSSEGGDRRCMILLARYLDASVFFIDSQNTDPLDRVCLKSALNLITTPLEDFFVLLGHKSFPIPSAAVASGSPGPWAEAVTWYRRAVEHARHVLPGSPAIADEGCDAEGLYDAAEDLWPVHRLLARMAEMYSVGGFGLLKNCTLAGELFNEAAESVMQQMNGRLASRYFELAEESYSNAE